MVVGLNARGMMAGGDMGFAIPADTMEAVVPQLREYGKVNWSWTGLQLQPIKDFNRDMYFDGTEGVIVADTDPDSPARKAGIQAWDRILKIDGKAVNAVMEEDLPAARRVLGLLPKMRSARVELLRGGKPVTVEMTPREKGKVEGDQLDCPRWDLTVKAINQFDNPDLPTLQPWMNTTKPPADRFVAVRNPYFHRVDQNGLQLPYIDRFILAVADPKLIPAKTGAGEADLQARDVHFNNYTFLKQGEKQNGYRTLLWRPGKGAHFALYPNLNVNDPVWRALLRDVRFRRALSLAIDRSLVNQVLYFGLGIESNNTVLPQSPLFREAYRDRWARYDKKQASQLLDQMGLKKGRDGIRRLPDGRPLEIIVETAGESTEQTDVLELIRETWREVGIKLFSKPSQREAFRNRVFAGETVISVWSGIENGLATPDSSPDELAPTSQSQLQWPKFGQYLETGGKSGEPVDIPEAKELARLYERWMSSATRADRERAWHAMLELHAEQQFTIGVVSGVPQPVVARQTLMNVPEQGFYNWDPGAFFGIYRPDTFWFK
jgi:peptide/nickel transport system substrate-binding protein